MGRGTPSLGSYQSQLPVGNLLTGPMGELGARGSSMEMSDETCR